MKRILILILLSLGLIFSIHASNAKQIQNPISLTSLCDEDSDDDEDCLYKNKATDEECDDRYEECDD